MACDAIMHLYDIVYNRWVLGWSNLKIVNRIILTSSNLELQLKELENIIKEYKILPLGRHMSLFPPPYIFSSDKTVVVDLSNLNQIDVFQNMINVDAGSSYKEVFEFCFKKNLYLPLTPPISIFESLGGMYSTGLISPWYGMPLESFIFKKKIFTFDKKRVYNSFGQNGIVLSFSIKCFPLEKDIPLYTGFNVENISLIPRLLQKLFFKYRLFPRILVGYMNEDTLEFFISLPSKLHKMFIKKIDEEFNIYNLSSFYVLPNIYPRISGAEACEEEKNIYLVSVQNNNFFKNILKRRCRIIYIDLLKKFAIVDCLKNFKNYRRKIVIKEGFIIGVDYRDV